MRDVCFIADVAVLSRWMRVSQALDFVAGVHPRFNRERAKEFLRHTDLKMKSRVRELSRGMVTQLHLALILAIDARLLVLDEPTLGLDLLYRRQFYDTLLNDYFDKDRTILLTTHQVEEIEHLLTDVLFLRHGRVTLAAPVDTLAQDYVQLTVGPDRLRRRAPASPRAGDLGRVAMFFGAAPAGRSPPGDVRTPSIADLFVAKMQAVSAVPNRAPSCRARNPRPPRSTPAVPARPPVLRTLIRREFWEHRALWIAPLSVALLLLLGDHHRQGQFRFQPRRPAGAAPRPVRRRHGICGAAPVHHPGDHHLDVCRGLPIHRGARTAASSSGSPCRCRTP